MKENRFAEIPLLIAPQIHLRRINQMILGYLNFGSLEAVSVKRRLLFMAAPFCAKSATPWQVPRGPRDFQEGSSGSRQCPQPIRQVLMKIKGVT